MRGLAGLLALALTVTAPGYAQRPPRPSQHGTVTQDVAGTTITIDYNRPVARGRKLFGQLVPWGHVWNPGADNGTTIELSTDVLVNGKSLKAGHYSIWAEPGEKQWTMIFNDQAPVWHTRYRARSDVLRVTAVPRTGAHVETLAFYFPSVDGHKAELVLHWGTVVVPLQIEAP